LIQTIRIENGPGTAGLTKQALDLPLAALFPAEPEAHSGTEVRP
jgi:hypothetical protein